MNTSVLERPTLVLNRSWQPVAVSTVARALIKVWNESARIVDPVSFQQYSWQDWAELEPPEGDPVIRTQWMELRVPEVITLTHYDRLPVKVVAFSRRNVFKRDNHTCQYCGRRPGSEELTIDHVIPRSHGGVSSWSNCVLACIECNTFKANRTPEQAGMPLRKSPVRPAWNPLYVPQGVRIESWSKFVSEAYWNVSLND
ncbi:MAG: HNH endonuclease [Planctomycetaceae bacterium]|nr:HNH endonuclease [Planctomycetaceae bacterium]